MPDTAPRTLELSASLHALLATLWERLGSRPLEDIDAGALEYVETEIGTVVPDAILALLAACAKPLGAIGESTHLYRSIEDTFEPPIPRAVRRDLVCFDHWGEHPMYFGGFAPTRDRSEPKIVVWDAKHWTLAKHLGWNSVEAYARGLYGSMPGEDDSPPLDLVTAPSAASLAAFAPRVVPAPAPRDRFVVHPKFGKGRVLRESEGRLEIDFGAHGVRKLLASFVRDA